MEYNKQTKKNSKYEFYEEIEKKDSNNKKSYEEVGKEFTNDLFEFGDKVVKFVVNTTKDIFEHSVNDIRDNYKRFFREEKESGNDKNKYD